MQSPEPQPSASIAKEESIFHAARHLSSGAVRMAFLEAACAGDPQLLQRINDLLAADSSIDPALSPLPGNSGFLPDLTAGTKMGGYLLLEPIGKGGMGRVYRARQLQTGRIVALKVISMGSAAAPRQIRRFETEANAVSTLQHPNIVPILEIGEWEGVPFFSMELIEGGSLADRIRAVGSVGEKNSTEAAFVVPEFTPQHFRTLVLAVDHAHQRGVLHRDLKPANVLLDSKGEPHLIDFGLAKLLLGDESLTRTADVMGTPSHMAPEQALGKPSSAATDIYGLGTILYELLTGRPPFQAESPMEVLRQVSRELPLPPSRIRKLVDPKLELICLRCLEKEPRHRYPDATKLAEDLNRWIQGMAIGIQPPGPLQRLTRWGGRNPLAASFIGTLFVGLLVTIFLLLQVNQEKNKQTSLASELREANQESTRLLARAVGMVKENLDSLWSNGERDSLLVSSDEIAALANRPVVANPRSGGNGIRITLGLMLEDSPTSRAQRYADLLGFLEQEVGDRLHRPVRIDVRFFKYVFDLRRTLAAGEIDFVRCGALPFLRCRQQIPGVQAVVVAQGEPKMAVLFTRAGSNIHSLEDLRGKRIAFGDTNSTVSFRAQVELAKRGVQAANLGGYDFLDASLEFTDDVREVGFDEAIRRIGYLHSHAQVIEGVLSGRYDAGVAAFRAFQINHSRGLAAIPDGEFVSSRAVWAARSGLDSRTVDAIRDAMTSLKSEPWLVILPDHPHHFEPATPATFAFEEAWLDKVLEHFPLKPIPQSSTRFEATTKGGRP